jgi:hypothetical protein
MKNELNWETGENGSLPMILDEKGLGLKGFSKFMFYICISLSLLSMVWVIIISIGAYAAANKDPTVPEYYKIVSIACIMISMMCINTLHKFLKDKRNYSKHVEISDGKIKFKEVSQNKTTEWEERIRKYTAVELRHYQYRGVNSWYVFLQHPDKDKKLALFAPEYKYQNASEDTKKEVLQFYGKLFDLPTNYLDLEASYKASHPEAKKDTENKDKK